MIHRRLLLCVLLASLIPAVASGKPARQSRPNVVLILADDLGVGDVSYQTPTSKLRTPHIDELAEGGRSYLDAYAPASVCTPTRYGLLTGRYAWRTWLEQGIAKPYASSLIEPGQPTIATWFQSLGYRTALVGKWHLGIDWLTRTGEVAPPYQRERSEPTLDLARPYAHGPLDVGFETFFGVDAPNFPPYAFIDGRTFAGRPPSIPKPDEIYGRPGLMQPGWQPEAVFPTLARRTLDTLEDLLARPEPFVLDLPLTAPHTPIAPSPAFQGRSGIGPYGDFVLEVDAFVGDLMATLDEHGVLDDTIVLFTSDNGSPALYDDQGGSIIQMAGHRPNGLYRDRKASPFDGGFRVPLVIHWPERVPAGTESTRPVSLVDVWPTLASLLDDPGAPVGPDGRSFADDIDPSLPLPPPRPGLVLHSHGGVFALRAGRWKLIEGFGWDPATADPRVDLFDLERDPRERQNLALRRPEKVIELWSKLVAVKRAETPDPGA